MGLLPPISIKIVVICLIWYSISSLTSQLTKFILVKFPYPLFLGSVQFLIGALLALTMLKISKAVPKMNEHFPNSTFPLDSNRPIFNKGILVKVLPLGLFQFTGKFLSLTATSLIPLATVSSIKALSPLLIVAGYRLLYGVKFPFLTYLSLTPLVVGVMLIIGGDSLKRSTLSKSSLEAVTEMEYERFKGLIYCFLSTFVFAAQNIYGKQLITWDSDSASTNPTSLVLDTDYSRPSTPALERKNNNDHEIDNKAKRMHWIRQRANSIRLPYSTSDLRLDEKEKEYNLRSNTYSRYVEHDKTESSVWGSIFQYFDAEHVPKPDKMTLILYSSSIGFAVSLCGFLCKELLVVLTLLVDGEDHEVFTTTKDIITVLALILVNALAHFFQTLLSLHLLSSIPALSYSIASMMKRIVLITVSMILATGVNSGDGEGTTLNNISSQQLYGLALIAIGLYSYDKWGSRSLKSDRS